MLNLVCNTHDTLKPPLWLNNTAADMERIEHADARAQRAFSKTVTLSLLREYTEGIRGEPVANFVLKCPSKKKLSAAAATWLARGASLLKDLDARLGQLRSKTLAERFSGSFCFAHMRTATCERQPARC